MHAKQTVVITGLVLAGVAGAATLALRAAPPLAFDSSRAYQDLRQIVLFGPRPPGSTALDTTRKYITDQLTAAGATIIPQPFDPMTPIGKVHMVNLIGRLPGARPDRIIFAGHYDTKLFREFRFVGANDAGSSTAFLLELARALKGRKNPFTIELLFHDGEEAFDPVKWEGDDHTYGSRYYVEAAQKAATLKQIRALILVDMIGNRDLRIKREQYSTPWLTDLIWASAHRLKVTQFTDATSPVEDDHLPFLNAGVQAVDIIDLDNYPYWHTADDTLDKVSARSLQAVGDVLLDALPKIEDRLAMGIRK
jgi:glutaminyl-peptide cyclotransferase